VGDEDTDLDDNIDKLESELMDAIAKKQAGQNVIDGYRQGMADVQFPKESSLCAPSWRICWIR